jgi:hypothetical protein
MPLVPAETRPTPMGTSPLRLVVLTGMTTMACALVIGMMAMRLPLQLQPPVIAHVAEVVILPAPEVPMIGPSLDAGPALEDRPSTVPTMADAQLDVTELANEALSPLFRCLPDALRWDPTVGGLFSAHLRFSPPSTAELLSQSLQSPMLAVCMARLGSLSTTSVPIPATMDLLIDAVVAPTTGALRIERATVMSAPTGFSSTPQPPTP